MQRPADVPDPHPEGLSAICTSFFFACRKLIRGLKVRLQRRVKKRSVEDASAFSAGWVLRPQPQIWLRAPVDRWVLAGQQFTHPRGFFSQSQSACSHTEDLGWFNKSDKSQEKLPTRLLIYNLGVMVLSGVASASERSDEWEEKQHANSIKTGGGT